MKIALAQQTSTPDRTANLDAALDAVARAAAGGASLVAFAEVVLDRFFPACPATGGRDSAAAALAEPIPGPVVERLQAAAREHEIVIVFNLYERAADGRFYDTSPVIDADGTLLGATRMAHIPDYPGFHEQQYYTPGDAFRPGDAVAPVYDTRAGKVGVAICYDRHYPEYWRALALAGADLVVIPQAGVLGEWPEGLFEAEVRTMAFQNGVWAALANRVGGEDDMVFAGGSFVCGPDGRVVARAAELEDVLLFADIDPAAARDSVARRLFQADRRPELYAAWAEAEARGLPSKTERSPS